MSHEHVAVKVTEKEDQEDLTSYQRSSSETSETFQDSLSRLKGADNGSAPRKRIIKRVKRFSDSDSDSNKEKVQNEDISGSKDNSQLHKSTLHSNSDIESDTNVSKSIPHKPRIQINANVSESEESGSDNAIKNKEQQLRMTNKRNKLRDKFKSLLTSRGKEPTDIENEVNKNTENDSSSDSGEEIASLEKIKQKIKQKFKFKPSICDTDTSDEETSLQKPVYKQRKERKMTKPTSPKHQRMSAKQAMENMQKIKSESNRMLREKEVSLPYHRPKALSLKDIMSRRKLAVSSDGKALPIKMNEEQLKQYAYMLEERQKEMMELCKSESEEEETNEKFTEADTGIPVNEPTKVDRNISTESNNNDNTITDIDNHQNYEKIKLGSINAEINVSTPKVADELPEEQDSETSIQLVHNDSVIDGKLPIDGNGTSNSVLETENGDFSSKPKSTEEETTPNNVGHKSETAEKFEENVKNDIKLDSQLISLHFDTENTDSTTGEEDVTEIITTDKNIRNSENNIEDNLNNQDKNESMEVDNEFSDDDIYMADIDNIIENAEIIKDIEDKVNSQFLVRDKPLNLNPKLTGAPGMVIDLDGNNSAPRKSGIELLKERFTYFSKLKTPEEMERERENKLKPGTQLKKLKQNLEEIIAERRSLEWAKRLEDEKQQQIELKVMRGEESDEDDIDKLDAAVEGKEKPREESEKSESEEDLIEDDIDIKDKPRVKNALVDDEAEESENDEEETKDDDVVEENDEHDDDDDKENESSNDDSDESSESEEELPSTTKKGRILKAFEDSDEEDVIKSNNQPVLKMKEVRGTTESQSGVIEIVVTSQVVSQDEELELAQRYKSASDDLFTSQESVLQASEAKENPKDVYENDEAYTQTFSILDSSKQASTELDLSGSGKMSVVCSTQSLEYSTLDDAALCPVKNSQNYLPLPSQIPMTQLSQSQPIGEDILALCTGQFYNNQFVSQIDENHVPLDSQKYDAFDNYVSEESQQDNANDESVVNRSIDIDKNSITDIIEVKETEQFLELNSIIKEDKKNKIVDPNLKSILDELADPEFDSPKPNKFFVGSKKTQKDTEHNEIQVRKKLIIVSDDEINEAEATETKKRKKLKKKKPEKRALQISDDEEDISELEEVEEYESDTEEDKLERIVEYDSEENEIERKPQNSTKKRKMAEFFENEAELTSEDEWVGSGDEDEAGLDRMEREEGDDETFHQGKLQRELGQIHMRDVLDQDKREVRLIQELLFEDGDLGGGGRQRKFRWNNMDGDEEIGTVPDELADTQETEFESEEQWRKQRHEREMFLRQMQKKDDPDESLNVSVNRSTIIKANLLSKTVSSLLMEVNSSNTEKTEIPVIEKKTVKDIPSPKNPFALLQQSYQGSLLSRGRGALARLSALAMPLAADDDAKVGTLGPSSRRNFVFTTLTPKEKEPKMTKRKADSNPSTPKLFKKMRTEDKQNISKSSLLDHFKV